MEGDAKEDVRSRLNIEDVIGEYVQLKRAGRNFKGLSPFTSERTPSFVVSPDKQIWHDFSSNKGGDVYSFVMEVEGIDFPAALELLARKAGVDLSQYQRSRGSGDMSRRKKKLYDLLSLAADYYQHSLMRNQHAVDYIFKNRGLKRQIVQDFRIGYAPGTGTALGNFLAKKGFNERDMRDAGVLGSSGNRDMFRSRMMVPLMDGQGQVIGFTARIIDDTPGAPKYINTPQTILYDKGRHVFGLHLAKEAIRKNNYAVVVEGNMDVIATHQAGFNQVVATAGTALTEFHLKALARLTTNIRLAFDSDAAGIAATERAIPIAQAVGVRLSIISLPEGIKDPDEAVQKDPKIWQDAVDSAKDVIPWLIDQYVKRYGTETIESKNAVVNAAIYLIAQLKDRSLASDYMHYLVQESKSLLTSVDRQYKELLERGVGEPAGPILKEVKAEKTAPVKPDAFVYQDSLLALAAAYPETRSALKGAISTGLEGEHRQRIAHYLFSLEVLPVPPVLPEGLQMYDTYVKILLLRAEERYGQWDSQDRYVEAAKLARDVVNEQKRNRKDELIAELRQAEAGGKETLAARLRSELNNLIKER